MFRPSVVIWSRSVPSGWTVKIWDVTEQAQSRYDWKAISLPFGDQSAPPAFNDQGVMRWMCLPLASMTNSACWFTGLATVLIRVKTIRRLSGDHIGSWSSEVVDSPN